MHEIIYFQKKYNKNICVATLPKCSGQLPETHLFFLFGLMSRLGFQLFDMRSIGWIAQPRKLDVAGQEKASRPKKTLEVSRKDREKLGMGTEPSKLL